ncbi:MAG: branched-chain amino acid ABC transporter permease [Pseudomonadota bacterium]
MSNDRLGLGLCAAVAAAAVAFALFSGSVYYVQVAIWIFSNAVLAAALRFVLLIGELNIATAAFFGLGAYASGVAASLWGWSFVPAILLAPVVVAAVSAVFGWITLRTRGPYFLLISFAFTEVVRMIYSKTDAVGGNSGMVGIFPPLEIEAWFPALVIGLLALTLFALYAVERSHLGRLFKAISINEDIPRSVGLNVTWLKVSCVVIASAAAGLAGGLHAYTNTVVTPGDFSFFLAVLALAYVKIGGEDHPLGPVVGAALLTLVGQWLAGFGMQENIFYGAIIVAALLLMPKGLLGAAEALAARSRAQRRAPARADGR